MSELLRNWMSDTQDRDHENKAIARMLHTTLTENMMLLKEFGGGGGMGAHPEAGGQQGGDGGRHALLQPVLHCRGAQQPLPTTHCVFVRALGRNFAHLW